MPSSPITHVFVLMLENHSFDNMFAMSGIPGITAAKLTDKNHYNGVDYPVQKGAPPGMPTDPGHEFNDVVEQLCGEGMTYPNGGPFPPITNSGFAANYANTTTEGYPVPAPADIGKIMQCFDTPNQLPVIYQLATEFALCDHWFSSLPGPTWPNRFFAHGASSAGLDHSPTTEEIALWEYTPFGGFTFPNGSIFDSLSAAELPWRIYRDDDGPLFGSVPQVTAIRGVSHIWVKSISDLAADLQGAYHYAYTFLEPNYGDVTDNSYAGGTSQHPVDDVTRGEALIKTVYEAIRNSPLWPSSLLIITYDEHGGFYDSVAAGNCPAPADGSPPDYNENNFTFEQYGVRVPAVVVSPLIAKGTVDHTVYDHASIPATLERLFELAPLTERDKTANDVLGLLSLTSPREDCPTVLSDPASPALFAKAAHTAGVSAAQAVPNRGIMAGVMGIMLKTELELSNGTEEERKTIIAKFEKIKTRAEAQAHIKDVSTRARAKGGRKSGCFPFGFLSRPLTAMKRWLAGKPQRKPRG